MGKRKNGRKHSSPMTSSSTQKAKFQKQLKQAETLLNEGNVFEALPLCEALFQQQPNHLETQKMLGFVRYTQVRYTEATNLLEPAYEKTPSDTTTRRCLFGVYKDNGQYDKALTMARVFLKHPLSTEEKALAFQAFSGACEWSSAEKLQATVIKEAIAAAGTVPISNDLMLILQGMALVDSDDILKLHQIYAKHPLRTLSDDFTSDQIKPTNRLKIAYLSPDFFNHAVAYFIYPVIAEHNRQLVEVYCYAHLRTQDAITNKVRAATNHFIDITDMNDHEVAQRIRADGIHVLVDLAGHTHSSRLNVLAWSPAPVQITYLGYPNTSGLAEVDFRITDQFAESNDGNYYTETLLHMPESFICFGMRPTCPRIETTPAESSGSITFGSFNNVRKMNPQVIDAWSQILNRVPNSRMAIKARWKDNIIRDNLLKEFSIHGIDSHRLIFLPITKSYDDHVEQYNLIDIALDTFPYSGTTTTCEALWMGVPVITLTGKTHANRVSYSILKNIGFTETIANSMDEYVDKAVELSINPSRISLLRKCLHTLFANSIVAQPERFTPQLESLYLDACSQKGIDLSEILGSGTTRKEEPAPQSKSSIASLPSSTNPFESLPGSKPSRLLIVIEKLTKGLIPRLAEHLRMPALPLFLVAVIPHSPDQSKITESLETVSTSMGQQFGLIKLNEGADLDPETVHALVSVCSQYFSIEANHGDIENLVHEEALAQGLSITEYKIVKHKEGSPPRKLHIGGKERHPDWEILDAIPSELTDHVGNANDLSLFEDNTFEAIYSSHVLEHFSYQGELSQVLSEWFRVMRPGGTLYASVPNLNVLCELFLNKKNLSAEDRFMVMRMMFGGQIDAYDFHKVGYSEEILSNYISLAGFTNIQVVPTFGLFNDTSNMEFAGKHISLNMIAEKAATTDSLS